MKNYVRTLFIVAIVAAAMLLSVAIAGADYGIVWGE